MITSQEKKKIENFINLCESMKNSYFWSSPGCASSRRKYEDQRSFEKTTIEFAGDIYEFNAKCKCSCKNIYFTKEIYKNGKNTTLLTLKNILKKIDKLIFA